MNVSISINFIFIDKYVPSIYYMYHNYITNLRVISGTHTHIK